MATVPNFKNMFIAMGWDVDNVVPLVETHQIKTMVALANVTDQRAGRIVKAIKTPGGNAVGHAVTESAEYGLIMAARIARNAHRVSRTMTCAQIKTAFLNKEKYAMHKVQHKLE